MQIKINRVLLGLVFIILVVFFVNVFVRYNYYGGFVEGSQNYEELRISQLNYNDVADQSLNFNVYYFVLNLMFRLFGINVLFIMPLILSLLSLFLFYLILRKLNVYYHTLVFTLFVYVLSPIYCYMLFFLDKTVFSLVILMWALYLFLSDKYILSLILFSILPLISFIDMVVTLTILLLLFLYTKKKEVFFIILFVLLFSVFSIDFFNVNYTLHSFISKMFFSDMGALIGFGFFSFILTILGIYLTWKRKYYFVYFYLGVLILFIFLIYLGNEINIFLNVVFAFFGGVSLRFFYKYNWDNVLFKRLTLLLLICGLIFSPIAYVHRVSTLDPNLEMVNALGILKEKGTVDDVVLSLPYNFNLIYYFSNKKTIENDLNEIMESRDLLNTLDLLKQNNVKYIFFDKKMTNLDTLDKPQRGLLFLLRNEHYFDLIYNGNVKIWSVNYEFSS